jgi:E3 ubiquitin-protein ligase DOA10
MSSGLLSLSGSLFVIARLFEISLSLLLHSLLNIFFSSSFDLRDLHGSVENLLE